MHLSYKSLLYCLRGIHGLTQSQDYFYVCPVHLKDRHFCSPIVDADEEAAKKKAEAMAREIEKVKKEYEEKQQRKKEKEKEKEKKDDPKDDKDKDKEDSKKADDKKEEKERDDKVRPSYSLIWLFFILLTAGRLMLLKSKAHLRQMTRRGSSLCISMDFFLYCQP